MTPKSRFDLKLKPAAKGLASLALALPLLVLFGWAFSPSLLEFLFHSFPPMVPWTAVGLSLLAFSNLNLQRKDRTRYWPSNTTAIAVLALSSLFILEYFFSIRVGVDTFLFHETVTANPAIDFPGRPSPQTSFAFFNLALAQILFAQTDYFQDQISRWFFQILNALALTISALAVLGYIYSATHLFGLSQLIGVSLPTSASILLLSISGLLLDREFGIVANLKQQNPAGFFLRSFAVWGILTPFLVAGFIRWGEVYQGLDHNYGMAAFVFFTSGSILGLAILVASSLKKQASQLEQLSKNEIQLSEANEAGQLKDRFLANMSHEVRTPLTAILGYLDFLREPGLSVDDRQTFLSQAEASAKNLLHVLDDVLDLSKLETKNTRLDRTPFQAQILINDVLNQFNLRIRTQNLKVEILADSSLPAGLISDPDRIRQILVNLMSNALKFTGRGSIQIRALFEQTGSHAGFLQIEVADTGIGIPKNKQAQLFQSFFQVDDSITRRYGGSGLGLSISQKLAYLLGGQLILKQSEPAIGSVFQLRIPCEISTLSIAKQISAPASDQGLDLPLVGLHLLLVEDNPDNQFLMSRALTGSGATVDLAENGEIAVSKALANRYAVILMDIQMPVMGGLEATRILRTQGLDSPIIALSAHAMKEDRDRSIEAGCDLHVCKPVTKKELVDAVKGVLTGPALRETV